jgi:hypothetical protein
VVVEPPTGADRLLVDVVDAGTGGRLDSIGAVVMLGKKPVPTTSEVEETRAERFPGAEPVPAAEAPRPADRRVGTMGIDVDDAAVVMLTVTGMVVVSDVTSWVTVVVDMAVEVSMTVVALVKMFDDETVSKFPFVAVAVVLVVVWLSVVQQVEFRDQVVETKLDAGSTA